MPRQYRFISGDSHLEIDSKWWVDRVPAAYRDQAPRVVRLPDGSDAWSVEGQTLRQIPFDLYGGKGRDIWKPWGQNYETTPGTGDAHQRIREQVIDGIDAEVLFPGQASGPYFWRNIKDDDAYKACVRAYNDYLGEDYCPVDPERLLGLGVIPMTNLKDALTELEHIQKLGLPGICMGTYPSGKGYATPEDDTFWSEVVRARVPVTVHIEFDRNGSRGQGPTMLYPQPLKNNGRFASNVDLVAQVSRFGRAGFYNAVQMALSGVFHRFPDLKIFWAETQIGWLAWAYEMAEVRYDRHRHWAAEVLKWEPFDKTPVEFMKENCYWGFQQDTAGVRLRDMTGVNRLIWATDFPHQESEFPQSHPAVINKIFAGVPENEVKAMVAQNTIDFFHLDAVVV